MVKKKNDNKTNNIDEEKVEEISEKKEFDIPGLPPEAKEKLMKIKEKLDKFKEKLVEKFEDYIIGISLLPPQQFPQEEEVPPEIREQIKKEQEQLKDKINVLVLVDDSDSQKMTKEELKTKLTGIIDNMAKEVDTDLLPRVLILTELWQNCYDGKYEILQTIALSAPIYDKGMLGAIKIAEVHKSMVLKKFEKYIVSYVLFGSLTRGEATPESDIDVAIIVDDTDVKKMTRAELRDKLRAIIIGMGLEAGSITGIQNKLNMQVYILTDFWDSVKDANPVMFTVLRDGVPLFDRGTFMPWKQLLKMGKIKPSPEAIDMFMSTGEQMISRVKFRLRELVESDIYWATLTPTQAALMLYGVAPPTPKETIELVEEIFVRKEKLLEKEYVEILKKIRTYYKEFEKGRTEISGKEVDELLESGDKYLKRIKRLFSQIEKMKEEESVIETYDTVISICRDALKMENVEKIKEEDILRLFKEHLIETGKIAQNNLKILESILNSKKDLEQKKLTKTDIEKMQKDARQFVRNLIEYIQRKRGRELERAKIKVKYGNKFGEVTILGNKVFIIVDLEDQEKNIQEADLDKNGALVNIKDSSMVEMEKAISNITVPPKVFIKEKFFESLKNIFGKDLEILINQ